jgi:hypothetical protein
MSEPTVTKAGTRLRSAVCDTQVVVIRGPSAAAVIECGGRPMLDLEATAPLEPMEGEAGEGTLIGKRYVDEELGIELLCTKPGAGSLSVGGRALTIKGAKPLPSSD